MPLRGYRTDSLPKEHNMFSSLKHKLSRKGHSNQAMGNERSMNPESNPHPQQNAAPATRRPGKLNHKSTLAMNDELTLRLARVGGNPFRDSSDAPPAYTPAPNAGPSTQVPAVNVIPATRDGADDPYAFLNSFDTVFLIDDSGSMAGGRWNQTGDALQTITPICTAHDADGIDIYFLNHPERSAHHNVTSSATVREIFSTVRPGGGTPTGQRLNQILKPYLRRYEASPELTKPLNIICITDGEPSDDVESPLIAAAKKLDKLDAPAWQVGVQFFQVGRDEQAKEHLKQLDDELAKIAGDSELRDIVDTVPFIGAEGTHLTGDGILKVVLGAVNRRLDRKKSKDLHH